MNDWRIQSSMVAASMFCVLAGSNAWGQQGAPPAELETLKRMMQEVISENKELRTRVRELEAEMTKVKAAMTNRQQAPAETAKQPPTEVAKEAAKEAPKEPAKEAATEAPKEPVKEAAKEATKEPAPEPKGLAKLLEKLDIGGAVEATLGWRRNFRKVSASDFTLSGASFDIEANIKDWARASIAADWDRDADKFALDEALITLGDVEGTGKFPLYLKAGRGVVPFGVATGATIKARLEDILTITDPLTVEVFEAKEDYLMLGLRRGGFTAGAYVFNGTTNRRGPDGEKHLEHYGALVGYALKNDIWSVDAKLSLMSSVFDSDNLTEAFPEATAARYAPGVAGVLRFGLGGFSLVTEYNAAIRAVPFQRVVLVPVEDGVVPQATVLRVRPSAWMIEAGYTTELFGKKTYGAVGYSQTYQLAGAFPKRRLLTTVGTWLFDGFRLALEYGRDYDYVRARGGTGTIGHSVTSRMTYEW